MGAFGYEDVFKNPIRAMLFFACAGIAVAMALAAVHYSFDELWPQP